MKLYVTCLSSNTTKSKLPSFQAHNELLFWLDSFELLVVRGGLFVVCCYCCELFLVGFVLCVACCLLRNVCCVDVWMFVGVFGLAVAAVVASVVHWCHLI